MGVRRSAAEKERQWKAEAVQYRGYFCRSPGGDSSGSRCSVYDARAKFVMGCSRDAAERFIDQDIQWFKDMAADLRAEFGIVDGAVKSCDHSS